ncbi:MAG TPA: response regulator, partial [Puia sp.]|nr:response regulator [Puia sp.]
MRILVIEDEERVATLIKIGLEEMGYAVTIASEGTIGRKLALSGLFDLIITDVMLPDINGIAVCKAIREELPQIPLIMLTALGTTDD